MTVSNGIKTRNISKAQLDEYAARGYAPASERKDAPAAAPKKARRESCGKIRRVRNSVR